MRLCFVCFVARPPVCLPSQSPSWDTSAWIPCRLPGFGGSFAFDELKALNLSKPTYDCTPLRTEDAVVESVVETAVKDFAARYNAMVSFDQKVTATRSCVLRVCGFCELGERVRVGLLFSSYVLAGCSVRMRDGVVSSSVTARCALELLAVCMPRARRLEMAAPTSQAICRARPLL